MHGVSELYLEYLFLPMSQGTGSNKFEIPFKDFEALSAGELWIFCPVCLSMILQPWSTSKHLVAPGLWALQLLSWTVGIILRPYKLLHAFCLDMRSLRLRHLLI